MTDIMKKAVQILCAKLTPSELLALQEDWGRDDKGVFADLFYAEMRRRFPAESDREFVPVIVEWKSLPFHDTWHAFVPGERKSVCGHVRADAPLETGTEYCYFCIKCEQAIKSRKLGRS